MAERHVNLTKTRVKTEHGWRKREDKAVKLGETFNAVAQREGFKSWNHYRQHLAALPE